MSLTPGTRLGPYEISAQIGVGGMGEVYRATDTHLWREVARAVASTTKRLSNLLGDRQRLVEQQGWQYDVSHDGRFLVNALLDDPTPITLLQNWKAP